MKKITVNGKYKEAIKMYRTLRGEMFKSGITIKQLARQIGVSEKTIRNKLSGLTQFTWGEALAIKKIVNPSLNLEELFK